MREARIDQVTPIDTGGAEEYCTKAMLYIGFALSAYVCVCLYLLLRSVRRAVLYNNWTVLTPAEQQQWLPYRRNDFGRFDFLSIILGGCLLVPCRIPLAIFLVASNGIWATLLTRAIGNGDSHYFSRAKLFRRILRFSLRLHSRLLLYVFGIWCIEDHDLDNGDEDKEHIKRKACIIVSNHVSCLDIPYFLYSSTAAFVSKKVLQNVPFIGPAADSVNCIYIDRESEVDRNLALQKIKERSKSFSHEPDSNPLVIFPEGTTTNGRCLLQFRRGAFCVFQSVQPVVLVYRCSHIDVAYELLPSLDWMILVLSSSGLVKLEAYWLPPISPPSGDAFATDEERALAFAATVREAMWAELCRRTCPLAASSRGKCPDWKGSGKLRMQLEKMLVERQRRHVLAPCTSEKHAEAHKVL